MEINNENVLNTNTTENKNTHLSENFEIIDEEKYEEKTKNLKENSILYDKNDINDLFDKKYNFMDYEENVPLEYKVKQPVSEFEKLKKENRPTSIESINIVKQVVIKPKNKQLNICEKKNNEISEHKQDSIVNSVINKFIERSKLGKEKYGTDLDRTDLSLYDWILHAQEEHMDAILYLEKIKKLIV